MSATNKGWPMMLARRNKKEGYKAHRMALSQYKPKEYLIVPCAELYEQVTGLLCLAGLWPFVAPCKTPREYFRFYLLHLKGEYGYWIGREWDGQPVHDDVRGNPVADTIYLAGEGQLDETGRKIIKAMYPRVKTLYKVAKEAPPAAAQTTLF